MLYGIGRDRVVANDSRSGRRERHVPSHAQVGDIRQAGRVDEVDAVACAIRVEVALEVGVPAGVDERRFEIERPWQLNDSVQVTSKDGNAGVCTVAESVLGGNTVSVTTDRSPRFNPSALRHSLHR